MARTSASGSHRVVQHRAVRLTLSLFSLLLSPLGSGRKAGPLFASRLRRLPRQRPRPSHVDAAPPSCFSSLTGGVTDEAPGAPLSSIGRAASRPGSPVEPPAESPPFGRGSLSPPVARAPFALRLTTSKSKPLAPSGTVIVVPVHQRISVSLLCEPLTRPGSLWSLLRSLHPSGGYPSRLRSLTLPSRSA